MGLQELLTWLSEFDPRQCPTKVHLERLDGALQDLQSRPLNNELKRALQGLQALKGRAMLQHPIAEELDVFFVEFAYLRVDESKPVAEQMEEDLLKVAGRLPRWEWNTERYQQAVEAVQARRSGNSSLAEEKLAGLELQITSAFEPYSLTRLAPEEITAEAVVGHRLLQRGCQEWLDGVNFIRSEPVGSLEEGLRMVENANRILVAVQKFSDRIERQVSFAG
jgi:hypothetical protein